MNPTSFWQGVYTAIVTPFKNGSIDYESFRRVIEHQIAGGVSGIVVMGTTGESPTLTIDDHLDVVAEAIQTAKKRIRVIAGTGSNDTHHAIQSTRRADTMGADGFLQVGPYYNKPSQEGLFQHFSAIAKVTEKPIMLYSIPGRSGIAINTDTVVRLHRAFPHINALKEASGSCDKVSATIQALGDDLTVLAGDDALTLPMMSVGAKGVVSVTSNLFPREMAQLVQFALQNNYTDARTIHTKYFPIFERMLSLEPNPVCIKYALKKAGLIESAELRLPLCEPTSTNQAILDDLLQPYL